MAAVSRPMTKAVALSHLDAGTRFIAADSIRNMGQEDRAAVMPDRNRRTNDFT